MADSPETKHPPLNDKESWKKIRDVVFFLLGSICFLFWLCNGPLRPDPTRVLRGHTWVPVTPAPVQPHLSPLFDWFLHSGCLFIGVALLSFAFFSQMRRRKRQEAIEAVAREDRAARRVGDRMATSAIKSLGGRRDAGEKKEAIEVEVNGKKVKLPAMRCDTGTLILPNDHRFEGLTFDKVIGQSEAKFEIQEFLDFLKHPEKYAALNARTPRGVLMHGAHGVGKTLLARTLASLCGLPVIEIGGSEFTEMFVGVGASRVRLVFDDLDELVKVFGGAILFIDEFDAIARARGTQGNGEQEQTLNQLLKEMDGIIKRPRVFTIAATNRKDILDPAAIRPGRFDRDIEFFNPNRNDRAALLSLYIPESIRAAGLDLMIAAKACPGASGAHVENIANEAKILTVRAGLNLITQDILDEAVLKVTFGARRDGQRQILTPGEVDTIKVHEGGHAIVYMRLTGRAPLRFTMVPRGRSGGHVAFHEDFETLLTKDNAKIRLAVAMGGAASTFKLRNGQEDSGISMDVKQATDLAIRMVTEIGMSSLGKFNLASLQAAGLVSDQFRQQIADEVKALIAEGEKTAYAIVEEYGDDLKMLIDAIDEHETMLAPDIEKLFNLPPYEADGVDAIALARG